MEISVYDLLKKDLKHVVNVFQSDTVCETGCRIDYEIGLEEDSNCSTICGFTKRKVW